MTSTNPQLKPWKVLQQQEIYKDEPWLKLAVQQVLLPDERVVDNYYRINMRDFAMIVAQTGDGQFILERQYKHGIGRVSLLLPGGGIDPGEEPVVAAQRELLEETGYVAEGWRNLGRYVMSANYVCCEMHIFSAQNAQKVAEPDSGDLEDMEILLLPFQELMAAVAAGEVVAIAAVAAIALATHPQIQM